MEASPRELPVRVGYEEEAIVHPQDTRTSSSACSARAVVCENYVASEEKYSASGTWGGGGWSSYLQLSVSPAPHVPSAGLRILI